MENERTITSLMSYFHESVKNKEVIPPGQWIEAAQYANVLVGDEHDKLWELHQQVSQRQVELIQEGKSATQAKMIAESTDGYKAYRVQKAKIGQIEEFIRIAKIQARLKDEEYKGY